MKRITPDELNDYEGKFLARDIFWQGQLLFKSNSIIDSSLINRVNEISKDHPMFIFVYSSESENDKMENLLTTEIFDLIDKEMKIIFDRYSHTIANDKTLMKKIVNFFLNEVLHENYFQNYLENLFIINFNIFCHVIRVTILSLIISIKANLNPELLKGIAIGALLHEIGKLKLFIEFPLLADTNHKYNIEERHLIQMDPIVGYNEVLNNSLVPLISKKIILLHYVWEDFNASYDSKILTFRSYPKYYEYNELTKDQKDITVNIVQVCDCFDSMFFGGYYVNRNAKHNMSLQEKLDTINYIRQNAGIIFSRSAANLLANNISVLAVGDKIKLNDGRLGVVKEHTTDTINPIITLSDGKELDLSEKENEQLFITDLINDRGEVKNGSKNTK